MAVRLDDRGLPEDGTFNEEWEITPRDARALMDDASSGFVLVDVREEDELVAASVPGALHVPLHDLALRIDEIGDDDDAPIGVLCHHGRRSMQGTALLREYGYPNARSVAGGIDLWSVAVDSGIPRYTRIGGECQPLAHDADLG